MNEEEIGKLYVTWLGAQIGEFASLIRTDCTFNAEELFSATNYINCNMEFNFADRLKEIHELMANFVLLREDYKNSQANNLLSIIDLDNE